MKSVQQTSLLAYYDIYGSLGKRQEQVYIVIREKEAINNRMIGELLGLPINSVTPRVRELVEKGLVKQSHIAKDTVTNTKTIFWRIIE